MRTNPRKKYAVYRVRDRHDWCLEYLGSMRGGDSLDAIITPDLEVVEVLLDEYRWRFPKTLLGDKFADFFGYYYRYL